MKKCKGNLGNVLGVFYYDLYDNFCFHKQGEEFKPKTIEIHGNTRIQFGGKDIIKKRIEINPIWKHV